MKQGVMTLQLVALLGCVVSSVNAQDAGFSYCQEPNMWMPSVSVDVFGGESCDAVATGLFETVNDSTQCEDAPEGMDGSWGLLAEMIGNACCDGPPKCSGFSGGTLNSSAIFGVCEDMQYFDPAAPFHSPWNQTEVNPESCGTVMTMTMSAGVNVTSSCSDTNPTWLADPTAQINNVMAYAGLKCCQGESVTCVDDGTGMPLAGEHDDDWTYYYDDYGHDDDHGTYDNGTYSDDHGTYYDDYGHDDDHGTYDNGTYSDDHGTYYDDYGTYSDDHGTYDNGTYSDDHGTDDHGTDDLGHDDLGQDDDDSTDDNFFLDGGFFNPCMDSSRYLPDHVTVENASCAETASFLHMVVGPNATCDSDFYGQPAGITARHLYDQGCCGDTATTQPACEGDEGTGWKQGDWQPCVNSADFLDGMVLGDMSCGTLAWSYAYMGATDGMECDAIIGDSVDAPTYGQANWYMKNMGCCGRDGPVKCGAENSMNPCKDPENFQEHVSLLDVFDEDDDGDDEIALETCGDLASMLSFIFEDDQCQSIQRYDDDDDDDNRVRRMLTRSRRLTHGDDDDDDDVEMTVSMIFQLMAMSGCCGEFGRSRCDTGVIDMDQTRNQWTRECGYPKKPERRMHPNDMMTTVLAMDMNEDDSVGVVFGCMGDVPDAEYRVRVKMLEPAFFDKKKKDGWATKEDREKMIKKSVVTIAGGNLVAVQPDDLKQMIPASAMEKLNQFTHIYKANVPLNGMSNMHFNKDIRQARVEVQRRLPVHDGHDGPSKWLVDHCMKATSPGFVLQMNRDD